MTERGRVTRMAGIMSRICDGRFFRWDRVRIASLLLLLAVPAIAVEHPGALSKDADCSSCHASKLSGKSVHSAMATSCMVCHVAQTQGDMTTLSLAMPKDKICFACHEKATALQRHSSFTNEPGVKEREVKRLCVNCHDAHSSEQRMLLREAALVPVRP